MTEYRHESVFTWGATPLKFGAGAADEIGWDRAQLGARRVLVVTDRCARSAVAPRADGRRRCGSAGWPRRDRAERKRRRAGARPAAAIAMRSATGTAR
ncbi:hypothetical protein [Saccharopolyspora sp. NFXS83]|uniref:hypothetical protein n=1 Tax=Saccharopolyspora sp. NFXS83 TaxID=2993560 RepID=UPI003A4DABEE